MIKNIKLPKIDKELAKNTALKRIGEYVVFMPLLVAGIYYLFIEDLIVQTSRTVATEVIDSATAVDRKN